MTTTTTHDAGRSRLARRAQNRGREIVPVLIASRSSSRVIRNPDSTKKTSTPTNPPENRAILAWNKMTTMTATARNPSMSGLNSSPSSLAFAICGASARNTRHSNEMQPVIT